MSTTWRHRIDLDDPVDLIGFAVEARDGGIGVVDESTWETDGDHLVVHTGEVRVLLRAGMIEAVRIESATVRLGVTRAQVVEAPQFRPRREQPPVAAAQGDH